MVLVVCVWAILILFFSSLLCNYNDNYKANAITMTSTTTSSKINTMLIDIGINLMHKQFHRDREAVIARAVQQKVGALILTGYQCPRQHGSASLLCSCGSEESRYATLFDRRGPPPRRQELQ